MLEKCLSMAFKFSGLSCFRRKLALLDFIQSHKIHLVTAFICYYPPFQFIHHCKFNFKPAIKYYPFIHNFLIRRGGSRGFKVCKVSSSSMFFVAEAVAQILGTAEKIIKSGSTLQLHCILKRATEEPLYVFW